MLLYSRNLVAVLFLYTYISGIILPPSQVKVHFAVDQKKKNCCGSAFFDICITLTRISNDFPYVS